MSELFRTEKMLAISDLDLSVKLSIFMEQIRGKIGVEMIYFRLLYDHGLRPSEPLNIKNWEIHAEDDIRLTMSKTLAVRKFSSEDLPAVFVECIRGQMDIFRPYNYQHMLRIYKTFSPLNGAVRKERLVQLYIFRHSKIKQLIRYGMNKETLNEKFAWMDGDTFAEYAYSKIYI